MKRALCVLLSLSVLAGAVQAQEKKTKRKARESLSDATEILGKTDAACKAVKCVEYEIDVGLLVADEPRIGKYQARVIASGFDYDGPEKYFVDIKTSPPKSAEVHHITAGGDGATYYVIDHQTKKAYEDIDPGVSGSLRNVIQRSAMIEFLADRRFTDEINGKTKELKGSKKVAGEECYVVHVVYAIEQAPEATWFISKKDFLPRGRVDVGKLPDGRAWKQTKMLTRLVVEPKLDKDAFKLKLPKGYERIEDFAP